MSTGYLYSILNDTLNGTLNSNILSGEIGISNISTPLDHIDSYGDNLGIFFINILSGSDKTTLDTTVANHDGYQTITNFQFWESNGIQSTTQQTFQDAISRTSGFLSAGIYKISWYFEMRVSTTGPLDSNGLARFLINGVAKGNANMDRTDWHSFSGWDRYAAGPGEKLTLSIEWRRDPVQGGNDTIDIRRLKFGIEFME